MIKAGDKQYSVSKINSGECCGLEMLFGLKSKSHLRTNERVECMFIRFTNWRRLLTKQFSCVQTKTEFADILRQFKNKMFKDFMMQVYFPT